jgi:hypothetical protein
MHITQKFILLGNCIIIHIMCSYIQYKTWLWWSKGITVTVLNYAYPHSYWIPTVWRNASSGIPNEPLKYNGSGMYVIPLKFTCVSTSFVMTHLPYLPWQSQTSPCHGWGSYFMTSYHRALDLIPGQSMWDLWWTNWHWNMTFSWFQVLWVFPCQHHSTKCSKLNFHSPTNSTM